MALVTELTLNKTLPNPFTSQSKKLSQDTICGGRPTGPCAWKGFFPRKKRNLFPMDRFLFDVSDFSRFNNHA